MNVLELSSSGIKLILGPGNFCGIFDRDKFKEIKVKTKTRLGLDWSGNYNLDYLKENILPWIYKFTEEYESLFCIGTEWARQTKNISEIKSMLPLDLHVLSGKQESELSGDSFLYSTKINIAQYSDTLIIDSGSLSTELRSIGTGKWISIKGEKPGELKRWFNKEIRDKNNISLVLIEDLMEDKNKEVFRRLDSKLFPPDKLKYRPDLRWIIESIGNNYPVYTCGTGLGIGVWYNINKYGKI